jgi:hypothetical protein
MNTKTFLALVVATIALFSCAKETNEPFVHQKIPIVVESEKITTIQMKQLVGDHMVGIQCSSQVWSALTNSPQNVSVQIKNSDNKEFHIFAIQPALKGTTCDQVPETRYLFAISGVGNATVEIKFPKLSIDHFDAEMVVCKTPEETER